MFRSDLIRRRWARFWMRFAGSSSIGRLATGIAGYFHPPVFGRLELASLNPKGYVAPGAAIHHSKFSSGSHVFIGDGVTILERIQGGAVVLEDHVHLYGDSYIQTGMGGRVHFEKHAHIQQRCYFSVFLGEIRIGQNAEIAPNCAFYAHNHGVEAGELIMNQPLTTKGGSTIGDGAWLGHGVVVLDGVRVGAGAVVGAGSIVARDIPDNAIAVGTPARVIKMRGQGKPGKP